MDAGALAAPRRLLRGLVARRWSSLALLVTAALTVGAATLGPLYARAAQESVLHDRLTAAAPEVVGVHTAWAGDVSQAVTASGAERAAPPAGVLAAYPRRVVGLRADAQVHAPGSNEDPQQTRLVARDGACVAVVLTSGRCPTAPGEAMLSARTVAGGYGYRLGGTVELPGTPPASGTSVGEVPPPDRPATLTVVGVYRPVDPAATTWFGERYFNAALSYADGGLDTVDAVFVDRAEFATLAAAQGEVDIDYPLDPDAVRLADVDDVSRQVRDLLPTVRAAGAATASSDLPAQLAALAADRRQVATGSLLVSLQLAVLALLVLFAATADALEARGGDVALAKLRGLSPTATVRFLLAEPVVLLLLAVPLGAALGLLATHLLAATVLVAGVPVLVPGAAVVAAVAAFAGAVLAAGLAARRVLTRPVLDQWRGAHRDIGRSRRTLVADLVVAAVAVAGLVVLTTGHHGTLGLLAPGLLVLAVALLGVRLLPPLARRGAVRTEGSPRLGTFLATRQVGRRPAALRLAVLLAVALGLAVFAVGGESVAAANRRARADVETGAPRVVAVQFAPGADPVAAARVADPDGRWAMVAARWLPQGGTTVTGAVLGVDTSRLAAVAHPTSSGPSTAALAHDVGPGVATPVTLTATSAELTVDASDLVGPAPYVDLVVQPDGRSPRDVRLGILQDGRHGYTADVPCGGGCRLVGVGWERPVSAFDPMGATTVVRGLTASSGDDTARTVDLGLGDPGGWRASSPDGTDTNTTGTVDVTADGLRQAWTSSSGGSAGLARVSSPDRLPVWADPGAVIRPPDLDDGRPGVPQVIDANGVGYPIRVVGTTAALPGVPTGGVLADLRFLRLRLPGFTAEATWSVWLGPDAPPDALARLTAAGLQPGAVTTTADRLTRLGRQGPALALALLLACALAAAVLATGATATAVAASGRRRAFELAALRVVGVPRAALTRATVLEQLALLGTALVLGVPAGLLAALLAMPVVPQFADTSPLPLTDVPAAGPVLLTAAAFLVLLVVTAVTSGLLLVRAAVPSRLREAAA